MERLRFLCLYVWPALLQFSFQFLKFFTDEKNLRTWVKDEWNKLYDTSFVQRSLLSPILR